MTTYHCCDMEAQIPLVCLPNLPLARSHCFCYYVRDFRVAGRRQATLSDIVVSNIWAHCQGDLIPDL